MLFSFRLSTFNVAGALLLVLVLRLWEGRSLASRSRYPLHSSARLSDLLPDNGLSTALGSNEPPVGEVKASRRLIEGLRGLFSDVDEDTLRKLEKGTRSEDDCAGLMGWEEAPGRARPAVSFCSRRC